MLLPAPTRADYPFGSRRRWGSAHVIQVVWEFVTKEMAEQRFMLVFGPGGAWSKLLSDVPGFRGTTLLCDTSDSRRFLVFDLWESVLAREEYLEKHSNASSQLDATLAELVESRRQLGVFQMRAEANVRARPRRRG